jgi:hypothetical protein
MHLRSMRFMNVYHDNFYHDFKVIKDKIPADLAPTKYYQDSLHS